jgi:hypothetical protein
MHLRLDNSGGACSQLSFFYAFAYVYDTKVDTAVRICCGPFPVRCNMTCRAETKYFVLTIGTYEFKMLSELTELSYYLTELSYHLTGLPYHLTGLS